jgi:xanthine dehydrogenase accessory factor
VITSDGTMTGWIGGSCSEPAVRREALRALADGQPRLLRISGASADPGDGVVAAAATCPSGGSLDIFIDPQLPRPVLLAFGETPAAQTLARLAELVGFRSRTVAFEELGSLEPGNDAWAVVCTMGHYDEDALAAALAYRDLDVALVASRRRATAVFDGLRLRGLDEATLARVRTPAGGVRGASQEEIALAALAEIATLRRKRRGQATAPPKLEEFATDPVCQMAVEVKRAAATARHQGQNYYFCSDGCSRTFLENPARFVPPVRLAG